MKRQTLKSGRLPGDHRAGHTGMTRDVIRVCLHTGRICPARKPAMRFPSRECRLRRGIVAWAARLRNLLARGGCRCAIGRIVTASILVFLNSPALQAADQLIATPVTMQLNEKYVDEVPVTAQVLAGVGLARSGNPAAAGRFSIYIPLSHSGDRVCVQVRSRDNRYWSENVFILPEVRRAAYVVLQYPSKHLSELREIPAGDLAILASAGECDSTATDELFVADWLPSPVAAPENLQVFINSGRADTYIITRDPDGKRNRAPCRHILEDRRSSYDTICDLRPLPFTGTMPFEILRHHDTSTLRSERFRIRLKP